MMNEEEKELQPVVEEEDDGFTDEIKKEEPAEAAEQKGRQKQHR